MLHVSPPLPRSFSHVSLYVPDVERAAAFFLRECGLGVSRGRPDRSAAFLSAGSNHHEVEIFAAQEERVSHLGLEYECEADFLAAASALVDAGIPIRKRSVVPGLIRSLFCEDPEGNGLHLFANLSRDWTSWRRGEAPSETWHAGAVGGGSSSSQTLDSFAVDRTADAPRVATFFAGGSLASRDRDVLGDFYAAVLGFEADRKAGVTVLRGKRAVSCLRIIEDGRSGLVDLAFLTRAGHGSTRAAGPCNLAIRFLDPQGWPNEAV